MQLQHPVVFLKILENLLIVCLLSGCVDPMTVANSKSDSVDTKVSDFTFISRSLEVRVSNLTNFKYDVAPGLLIPEAEKSVHLDPQKTPVSTVVSWKNVDGDSVKQELVIPTCPGRLKHPMLSFVLDEMNHWTVAWIESPFEDDSSIPDVQ